MKQVRDEIAKFIGLFVIGLTLIGLLGIAVYLIIGVLTDTGRHLLATALVFAVPGAYLLGLQVARSHKAGLQQGINLKLSARERTHLVLPSKPIATSAARFDDLLPSVGQAVIVTRSDDNPTSIDL